MTTRRVAFVWNSLLERIVWSPLFGFASLDANRSDSHQKVIAKYAAKQFRDRLGSQLAHLEHIQKASLSNGLARSNSGINLDYNVRLFIVWLMDCGVSIEQFESNSSTARFQAVCWLNRVAAVLKSPKFGLLLDGPLGHVKRRAIEIINDICSTFEVRELAAEHVGAIWRNTIEGINDERQPTERLFSAKQNREANSRKRDHGWCITNSHLGNCMELSERAATFSHKRQTSFLI